MKSRMIAKTEKRIMAVMLSLMMVVGVFAGMKLDVKAANTYTAGQTLHVGDFVKVGDTVIIPAPSGYNEHYLSIYYYKPGYKSPDPADVLGYANKQKKQLSLRLVITTRNILIIR